MSKALGQPDIHRVLFPHPIQDRSARSSGNSPRNAADQILA